MGKSRICPRTPGRGSRSTSVPRVRGNRRSSSASGSQEGRGCGASGTVPCSSCSGRPRPPGLPGVPGLKAPWEKPALLPPISRRTREGKLRALPRHRADLLGGARGTRTPDLLIANETRYQLRHSPGYAEMVAPALPPPASRRPVTRPTYPDPGLTAARPSRAGPAAVPGASRSACRAGQAGTLPYSPAARRRLRTASRSMGWNSRSSISSSGGTGTWALTGRTGEATTSCSPVSRSSIMRRGARAASV